jgi:hypothetical protein
MPILGGDNPAGSGRKKISQAVQGLNNLSGVFYSKISAWTKVILNIYNNQGRTLCKHSFVLS